MQSTCSSFASSRCGRSQAPTCRYIPAPLIAFFVNLKLGVRTRANMRAERFSEGRSLCSSPSPPASASRRIAVIESNRQYLLTHVPIFPLNSRFPWKTAPAVAQTGYEGRRALRTQVRGAKRLVSSGPVNYRSTPQSLHRCPADTWLSSTFIAGPGLVAGHFPTHLAPQVRTRFIRARNK